MKLEERKSYFKDEETEAQEGQQHRAGAEAVSPDSQLNGVPREPILVLIA